MAGKFLFPVHTIILFILFSIPSIKVNQFIYNTLPKKVRNIATLCISKILPIILNEIILARTLFI